MSTNIHKILSPDLFVENESILFDRRQAAALWDIVPPLGAITVIASDLSDTLERLTIECGNAAVSLLRSAYNEDYRLWLFVSDGPWRQASRLARYHKLWKSHRDLVESASVLSISEEVLTEADGLIRFSGLLEFSYDSCDKALNAVRTNSSFAMFFSKRLGVNSIENIRSLFSCAFPARDGIEQITVDWLNLALALCPQGDILLRATGLFDDREAAVDLIALRNSIVELFAG